MPAKFNVYVVYVYNGNKRTNSSYINELYEITRM